MNIFLDFLGLTNKIQGLSRSAKKIQGLFQAVATLDSESMLGLLKTNFAKFEEKVQN